MNPLKEPAKTFPKYPGFLFHQQSPCQKRRKGRTKSHRSKVRSIRKNMDIKNYVTNYNRKVYRGSLM